MADEDKKGKAVSASTPAKSDTPKKAAVKKKVAKKKAARKKVAKKKTAVAATPASETRSEKSEQQAKVPEKSRDSGGMGDEASSKAKSATAVAPPATGNQSRKLEVIFVLLLVIFLVTSVIILRDEKAREGTPQQQQGILQSIMDTLGNKKADTASLPQEETESAPPVPAPEAVKEVFAPANAEKAVNEEAAAEAAAQVATQYPATSEPPPQMSNAPAPDPVTAPASEPTADLSSIEETAVTEPAVAIPVETEVPTTDAAAELPPAQVSEPAGSQVQALEEPAAVAEPVIDQPVAVPPIQPGYNPYSRRPYAYPGGYRRDYDRSYDWGYPRRPPQRWSW